MTAARRTTHLHRAAGWSGMIQQPRALGRVREAIERLGFSEPVVHVEGTEVAFLRKQAPLPPPGAVPTAGPVRVAWEATPGSALAGDGQPGVVPEPAGARPRPGTPPGCRGTGGRDRPSVPLDARLAARLGRGPGGAGAGAREAPVAAAARAAAARALGADAALGVRQPAQGLAANDPHDVDEVWAYSRSSATPTSRPASRPAGSCRALGVDPEVFRPGPGTFAASAGPERSVPVRRRDDFPQGDRCAADRLRPGLSAVRRCRAGHQGHGIEELLSRADGRGQRGRAARAGLSGRVYRPQPERARAGRTLCRLRLPGAPVPRRGLRLAGRRGHGLRPAGDRHRRGAALDYATDETAFLIPARRGQFAECRVGDLETISRLWLYRAGYDALVELLRSVASDPAAARVKGAAARAWIRGSFAWHRPRRPCRCQLSVVSCPCLVRSRGWRDRRARDGPLGQRRCG